MSLQDVGTKDVATNLENIHLAYQMRIHSGQANFEACEAVYAAEKEWYDGWYYGQVEGSAEPPICRKVECRGTHLHTGDTMVTEGH